MGDSRARSSCTVHVLWICGHHCSVATETASPAQQHVASAAGLQKGCQASGSTASRWGLFRAQWASEGLFARPPSFRASIDQRDTVQPAVLALRSGDPKKGGARLGAQNLGTRRRCQAATK